MMIDDIVFNVILDNPIFGGLREILINGFSNPTFKDSDKWTDDKFLINAFGEEYGEELNVDVINMQIETWIENNKTIIQNEFTKIFECSFIFDRITLSINIVLNSEKTSGGLALVSSMQVLSLSIVYYFDNAVQKDHFRIPMAILKAGKLPKNVEELNEIAKLMKI